MAARVETWLVDQAVIRGIAAFAAGYVVGALPVAWLLARRRPGIRSAVLAVVLEVLKGAAVGLAARLYTDSGWFIATAIAGCVAGDAFPVGFRRGGRGLVPLVSGLVVALPTAGVITAITAIPTALFTSMRGSVYDAVVLVAVPVGLLLGTREWQSLGPAAAIVLVLLARSHLRRRRREAAVMRRPAWQMVIDVDETGGESRGLGLGRHNRGPWDS
ncbi:MAG: glycerol-3-phosphate acyltransferase [Chloroflexi bacterium]|nr:MAG: glycerol-3-phosphate acyltransferase [Chloroflexota bacterium]